MNALNSSFVYNSVSCMYVESWTEYLTILSPVIDHNALASLVDSQQCIPVLPMRVFACWLIHFYCNVATIPALLATPIDRELFIASVTTVCNCKYYSV